MTPQLVVDASGSACRVTVFVTAPRVTVSVQVASDSTTTAYPATSMAPELAFQPDWVITTLTA
jgi:hypothetical protein